MTKALYANGDSFTFGMEIIADYDHSEANKEFAYPASMASLLGINTCINGAYVGCGNEFIFRQTIFDLLDLEKEGYRPEDVFVVVGWSCVDRTEISASRVIEHLIETGKMDPALEIEHSAPELTDFGSLFINPGYKQKFTLKDGSKFNIAGAVLQPLVNYIWHYPTAFRRDFGFIVGLEHYLRSKGYKFLFHNTIYNLCEFDSEWKPAPVSFDAPEYYDFEKFGIWNWSKNHYPEHLRAQHHADKFLHDRIAKMFADYIIEKKLI